MHNEHPECLRLALSGWPPPGPNAFHLHDGNLHYRDPEKAMAYDQKLTATPTRELWVRFRAVCDATAIWSWPIWLGDEQVIDGLQWRLQIRWGSQAVESDGQVSGAPRNTGRKLLYLHRALQRMVGWRGDQHSPRDRHPRPRRRSEGEQLIIDAARRFVASERAVTMKEAQRILVSEAGRRGLDLLLLAQIILG